MSTDLDMADICTSPEVRRAAEICAVGNHSLLLVGLPGAGKTMVARRLVTILPEMTEAERNEVNRIRALAKLFESDCRPFRAPHYTVSELGLWGKAGRPGEIALANHGVLFLDEILEFRKSTTLELFHQMAKRTLPTIATTLIVAAANPCFCGNEKCKCSEHEKQRHTDALIMTFASFDIAVGLPRIALDQARQPRTFESSATIRERVIAARRFRANRGVEVASFRGDRVARTIADMAGSSTVEQVHLDEAATFTASEDR